MQAIEGASFTSLPNQHKNTEYKNIMTTKLINMFDSPRLEMFAKTLKSSPNYRVLHALDIKTTAGPPRNMFDDVSLLVLDTETTGLDPAVSKIIEFSARPVVADCEGEIIHIGEPITFLEDPGAPLPEEIRALTGLTDDDLRGQRIDDDAVIKLFEEAHFVVAHNSGFDRPFVENRFSLLPRRPWACSCNEIAWKEEGFEGKSLNSLLMQVGLFQSAGCHRAANDVDALVALLMAKLPGGRGVAELLVETAKKPTLRVEATGAHFDTRNALRGRGYRWDAPSKVWSREIDPEFRQQEEDWLAESVYAPNLNAKASAATVYEMTALERYSSRLP